MIELYNGDCIEELSKVDNNCVDLVCIDPPYNISKASWDEFESAQLYVEWIRKVVVEIMPKMKESSSFYIWHNDFNQMASLHLMLKDIGLHFMQMITWDKYNNSKWNQLNADVFVKGKRNYSKQSEYVIFYTKQKPNKGIEDVQKYLSSLVDRQTFEGKLVINGFCKNINSAKQNAKNILGKSFKPQKITREQYELIENPSKIAYSDLLTLYSSKLHTFNTQSLPNVWVQPPEKSVYHPTQKPMDLIKNIVLTSSNEGDLVLDCFMGSGTTGVACKNLNRKFIGIELDETYFNIAKERIENSGGIE